MEGFRYLLLKNIAGLSTKDKELFDRIYTVTETVGKLVPPKEMYSWIEDHFGTVDAVSTQDFVKVNNKISYEGAVFNDLRTKRPVVGDSNFADIIEQIEAAKDGPFSHPKDGTPEDTFGRIVGKYCITAANIAKYDGLHGLVIHNDHNPFLFSRKRVRDYFAVARKWFSKAHESNPNALYPLYTWNCLWKAGASVIHGHSQLVLTEGIPYAKVELLRVAAHKYQEQYRSNYFYDDYYLHEELGLGFDSRNVKIMARITPVKEKEVMILSDKFNDNLADVVSDILTTLKEKLAMVSFNLSIILPPMQKTEEVWEHMPVIVRIVDRGGLTNKTADIGAMELYAQSIIGTNPYEVCEEFKKALLK